MKFPKDNSKLTEIFNKAQVPKIAEFDGEYYVNILTTLPNLRRFSHRKKFRNENGKVIGCNILFKNMQWGHFFVEEGVCKDVEPEEVIVINYNVERNPFVFRKIRDHVRCVEEGRLYIGRFNYVFMGKVRFFAYFTLEKII